MKSTDSIVILTVAYGVFAITSAFSLPTQEHTHAASQGSASTMSVCDDQLKDAVLSKLGNGDTKGATRLVQAAISANHKNAMAFFLRASILYTEHANTKNVIAALDTAIQLNPNFIDAFVAKGKILAQQKDYRGALRQADKAVAIDRTNEHALELRTNLHRELKDYRGLVADFTIRIENDAYTKDPALADFYCYRARAWESLGDKEKALEDLHNAQQIFLSIRDIESAEAVERQILKIQKST